MNWPLVVNQWSNWGYLLNSTSDVTLFVHSASPITFYTTNGIVGPTDTTKGPLTIIFDNNVVLSGGPITGNVRILVNGTMDYEVNGSGNDRLMVASNGNMILGRAMQYGLLSSNGSITLNSSCYNFVGQIIANGDVYIATGSITYDTTVANTTGFTWPEGME